jgi:hypothetical protein
MLREPARAVQRYSVRQGNGFSAKVSSGNSIVLKNPSEAYADEKAFTRANSELGASRNTPILLEMGQRAPAEIGEMAKDRALYQVRPVHKKDSSTASPEDPVAGEDSAARAEKLRKYQHSLRFEIIRISELKDDILKGRKKVDKALSDVTSLAQAILGPVWMHTSSELGLRLVTGGTLSKKEYGQLLEEIAKAYLARLDGELEPELTLGELLITLPADCRQAAAILTGRPADQLNDPSPDPGVGGNYWTSFGGKGGWTAHYATVVMKDAGDNLTFEAAARSYKPLASGKTVGYFSMYGTKDEDQTFASQMRHENRQHILYTMRSMLSLNISDEKKQEFVDSAVKEMADSRYRPIGPDEVEGDEARFFEGKPGWTASAAGLAPGSLPRFENGRLVSGENP